MLPQVPLSSCCDVTLLHLFALQAAVVAFLNPGARIHVLVWLHIYSLQWLPHPERTEAGRTALTLPSR